MVYPREISSNAKSISRTTRTQLNHFCIEQEIAKERVKVYRIADDDQIGDILSSHFLASVSEADQGFTGRFHLGLRNLESIACICSSISRVTS